MKIAIDFDGTIVEDRYPLIGKPRLFAFETMKELQKRNHQLILWTYRKGEELKEAVDFCRKRGIEFYSVNKNYPEEVFDETVSRKIIADIYIDDRNLGGFPGWSETCRLLDINYYDKSMQSGLRNYKKRNIFKRFLNKF